MTSDEVVIDDVCRDLAVNRGRGLDIGGCATVRALRTEALGGFDARIERLTKRTYQVTIYRGRRRQTTVIEL